jgi:hypothetical protein
MMKALIMSNWKMNTLATTRISAGLGLHTLIAGLIECLGCAIRVALIVANMIGLPEVIAEEFFVIEALLMDSVDGHVNWYGLWLEIVGRVLLFSVLLFSALLTDFIGGFILKRLLMMGFGVDILLIEFIGW